MREESGRSEDGRDVVVGVQVGRVAWPDVEKSHGAALRTKGQTRKRNGEQEWRRTIEGEMMRSAKAVEVSHKL